MWRTTSLCKMTGRLRLPSHAATHCSILIHHSNLLLPRRCHQHPLALVRPGFQFQPTRAFGGSFRHSFLQSSRHKSIVPRRRHSAIPTQQLDSLSSHNVRHFSTRPVTEKKLAVGRIVGGIVALVVFGPLVVAFVVGILIIAGWIMYILSGTSANLWLMLFEWLRESFKN